MKKSLPQLDEQHSKKLASLLKKGKLIPMLNNTKWSELIEEMLNAEEESPQFRTRSVFAPKGFVTEWDGEWYYHIHPVAELEWVELRSKSQDWLLSILKKHNIPFSEEQGVLRVWGYTRPEAEQPSWK